MTIVQISDTHNCHRQLANLPAADVLVHCGDFTDMGTEQEVLDFLNWLIELPYKHKVFVVLSLKVCKLFFSFILVISIFLYFLPTFELVYFSFVSPFSFLHCYGSQEKDDRLC